MISTVVVLPAPFGPTIATSSPAATVIDPDKALKTAYRVAGRPQTYFVDRNGVLRSIQIGEMQDADFERQYAQIAK